MNWKISILIISHDSNEFLQEAIDSAKSQTVIPHEILVMGDKDMPLVDFNIGDIGMNNKFNKAVSMCSGNAVLHLSEDDKIDPSYIEKTINYLNDYDIVYSDMMMFGDFNSYISANEWNSENMKINTIPFVTSLITKEMWNKVGGYEEGINNEFYGDWDFWWRCMDNGAKAKHVKEALFYYRIHGKQDGKSIDHDKYRLNTILRNIK